MKVLLVSSSILPQKFRTFIDDLRSKVGTCEHLALPLEHSLSEKRRLFESYLNSMSFDRCVICYQEPSELATFLQFCDNLSQVTLISLQPERYSHRKQILDYADMKPWIRWAGSDEYSYECYRKAGIDAYLLPPLSTPSRWQVQNRSKYGFRCHVFGDCSKNYTASLPQSPSYCRYACAEKNMLDYIEKQVKNGDVVLVLAKKFLDRQLVGDAVANGAAVVVPESDEITLQNYDSLMRMACISIDTPKELITLFEEIRCHNNAELMNRIHSLANLFSPISVAIELSRILMHSGRDRATFRRHPAWL